MMIGNLVTHAYLCRQSNFTSVKVTISFLTELRMCFVFRCCSFSVLLPRYMSIKVDTHS